MSGREHGASRPRPQIWAIGGGKGGVGKSVIAVSLGVTLAGRGREVALVDADLGGANLHTLLGVPDPPHTLSDFIARRIPDLREAMAETPQDRLWLLSGSRALLEMANPKYSQKAKLLRHVSALPVDVVILDLGAGSAFNVLDFFISSDLGILVVVPEATSVENAYHFLKAAFFRRLKRATPRDVVRSALAEVMRDGNTDVPRSPRDLVARVAGVDPEAGAALCREATTFRPAVLANRIDGETHVRLAEQVANASRSYFGTDVLDLGPLPSDPLVPRSVQRRRPVVTAFPESQFARAVRRLAQRLDPGDAHAASH
jgi:flagellar biosynthesis protein FlhG